jgi:hypothetical protein
VEATKYWSKENNVEGEIIAKNLLQSEASDIAHNLEKQKDESYPDYKIIQTSGI